MDTTRDILYRGFKLNDQAIQANIIAGDQLGAGVSGSTVSSFDPHDVDVVQFTEKRSEQDGMDAGHPFLGMRRIRMSGTLYALSRNLLYDKMFALRAALSPILSDREVPADKGYQPLYFSVPTNNQDATVVANSGGKTLGYPAGAIDLHYRAMPRAFQAVFQDNAQGGSDGDALAIPWQASFICKDPTLYSQATSDYIVGNAAAEVAVTGVAATDLFTKATHGLVANDKVRFTILVGGTGITVNTTYYVIASGLTANDFRVSATLGGATINFTTDATAGSKYQKTTTMTGNTINRGTYITPLNMLFSIGNRAGTIDVQAGDSVFSLAIPASTGDRLVRVKGQDKLVTIEEASVELTRQDIISFSGSSTWAMVPTGTAGYTITLAGLGRVDASSHMWFWEAYA